MDKEMKLFKVSGYLWEPDAQTIENLSWFFNRNFDIRQLHIEEYMPFIEDERLEDLHCDMAVLEEHFVHPKPDYYEQDLPEPGERWRHFKGNVVEIVGIAEGTEYHEQTVIYRYEGKLWARPLDMFMSETDRAKYPDAEQRFRFMKVQE